MVVSLLVLDSPDRGDLLILLGSFGSLFSALNLLLDCVAGCFEVV